MPVFHAMGTCDEARDALSDLLAAAPGTPPPEALRAHVASCRDCAGFLDDARAGRAAFERRPIPVPPGLRDRILGGLPSPATRSPRRRWAPLAAAALLLAGAAAAWSRTGTVPDLVALRGEVRLPPGVSRGGDAWSGGAIETGSDGSATLRWRDGSEARIGPDAALRNEPDRGERARLILDRGTLDVTVAPARRPFGIRTPHGEIRVTGTRFRVRTGSADAVLEVPGITGPSLTIVEVDDGTVTIATDAGAEPLPAGTRGFLFARAAPPERQERRTDASSLDERISRALAGAAALAAGDPRRASLLLAAAREGASGADLAALRNALASARGPR